MENKEEQKPGLGSFLPVLLIGIAVLLFFQFSGSGSHPPVTQEHEGTGAKLTDFEFQSGPGEIVSVDTGNFIVKLSSQGGRIDKFYVKKSKELNVPDSVLKTETPEAQSYQAFEGSRGNGFDFQFHGYYYGDGASQLGDPALNKALFKKEGPFQDKDGVVEVRFRLPVRLRGQNLEIVKIYRFLKGEHFFRQIAVIRNLDKKEFVWGGPMFFRPFGDVGPSTEMAGGINPALHGRFYYYNGEFKSRMNTPPTNSILAPIGCGENLKDKPYSVYAEHANSLHFVGAHSKYFFAYAKFLDTNNPQSQVDGVAIRNEIDPDGKRAFTTILNDFKLAPSTGELDLQPAGAQTTGGHEYIKGIQQRNDAVILDQEIYYGVRTDESHAFANEALARTEFGSSDTDKEARGVIYTSSFLALFSKVRDAIVWVMRFLHVYLGNYGWVIIVIAVSFKLITFPLNQMQAKSMKRMSALKPELEKIQEKYADNPAEKQKRTMEVYKKHNVNPAKGCVPIVIQIPVFIALYSAFSESIELWRSPFILWMTDLSAPDTIYTIKDFLILKDFHINVLPLFMVASQLLQQRLTTVITDPQQKIMMYMMPVIMIFFFWTMPSGVTLYWTVQNVLAIVWQLVTNRMSDDGKTA